MMMTSRPEASRPPDDRRVADRRAGFALEASLMILLLISGLVLVLIQTSLTSFRSSVLDYTNSRAFYAAEGGADWAMSRLNIALQDATLDEEELNSILPPELEGFSFDSFTVEKVGGMEIETITDGPFAGLYSQTQDVEIHSQARAPTGSTSAIRISGKAQAIPIFQFGVFFEKDIEFTNAPTMHFEGRIHSNGNIYFSSGRNTYFYDVITTPNEAIWNRKDRNLVRDHTFIYDAGGRPVRMRFDSRSHPDPDDFRARSYRDFDDRLKTDAYGVDSLKLPLPQGVDPQEVMEPREAGDGDMEQKAKYSWKSDMYVTVDLENMSTRGEMCGGPGGYPPIEESGTIAIDPQEAVLKGQTVTFRASHAQLTCAEFDARAHLRVVAGGSGYDGGMGGCEFAAQIPSDADELEIEVEIENEDYAQLSSDIRGLIKYNLEGAPPDETQPWPTITVDRSGGRDVPGQRKLCLIFDWTSDAWYDPREENFVDQLELDVAQLFAWTQAAPGSRGTDVLYVNFVWESATGAPDPANDGLYPALRIANGANIRAPVTFASNNPLYILGDFNTAGTWQPASLVGDAITTLSNGWSDSQHQTVSNFETNAQSTSIYAAVLAGHEDTDCDWYEPGCPGGNYGGGVHSFVRYIEDWTYDTYTFRGSLVSLHVSRVAQGEQSQSFYEPPIRDIRFDTRFQDPENLPPGTPVVGNVVHTAFRPVY